MEIKRYAHFSSEGEFVGFLSSDVHKTLPENTVEITDEKQEEMIQASPFSYKLDTEKKEIINPDTTESKTLSYLKTSLKNSLKDYIARSLKEGVCDTGLGWSIDCRRWNHLNDLENIQILLSQAKRKSLRGTDRICPEGIRGKDNDFHSVTVREAKESVLPAMEDYIQSFTFLKWSLEEKIEKATTEEELKEIKTWK